MPEAADAEHELVCLLRVREGECDLVDCLDSVASFADAIVALDEGGGDATSEILRRHPVVKAHLSIPRGTYESGSDAAATHNRLLETAAALAPRWVLSLDAAERIYEDDARALRALVRETTVRGVAFGFRTDDGDGVQFRLFAYRSGQRFPRSSPEGARVPTDIPREHWIETTLTIRAGNGSEVPPTSTPVEPTSVDTETTPLAHPEIQHSFDAPLDPSRPTLSTIMISQDDRDRIEEVIEALVTQKVDQPSEIILVNSGRDGTAELVRAKYPQVKVVHLSEPALPGKARNAGLAVARGDFITFPGSHIVVPPGSLQKRVDAHEQGYAMASGAVLNGTDTRAGWASYFLDHCVSLTGRPSGRLRLPPSRCSYMRGPLTAIGGFPEDRRVGEDTVVNARLYELGYRACYSSEVRDIHKTPCTSTSRLLQHHFERGLGFGRILWEQAGKPQALRPRAEKMLWLVAKYPFRRLRFIFETVRDWGSSVRRPFVLSLPLVVAGVASAVAGAIVFLARPSVTSER